MFPTPAPIRLRQCRSILFLALAFGQLLCIAHAAGMVDATTFAGNWKYIQTCGYKHSATLTLTQTGNEVSGYWSDGTRLWGADGPLKGHVRDGKLYVRYCSNDARAGYSTCPSYPTRDVDHFVRQGNDLTWYSGDDTVPEDRSEKYVVLHRVIKGQPVRVDDHCPDGQG